MWRFEIFSALKLGEGKQMAKQVSKVLQVRHHEVVPEVAPEVSSEAIFETAIVNLFDIDPYAEPESPLNIDLDLDQIEDSEE